MDIIKGKISQATHLLDELRIFLSERPDEFNPDW